MKNHLKIISLLSLFVITATTCFIFAKRPADDKPETVLVKVYGGEIEIYYGNDKTEEVDFKQKEEHKKLIDVIQKLNAQGYKVISQSQCLIGTSFTITETWVLTLK